MVISESKVRDGIEYQFAEKTKTFYWKNVVIPHLSIWLCVGSVCQQDEMIRQVCSWITDYIHCLNGKVFTSAAAVGWCETYRRDDKQWADGVSTSKDLPKADVSLSSIQFSSFPVLVIFQWDVFSTKILSVEYMSVDSSSSFVMKDTNTILC